MADPGTPKGPEAGGGATLDQEEIDSLLGGEPGSANTGLGQLIDNPNVSYERLPLLEVVFDRLVRIMTASLRQFTSENVELRLDDTRSMRSTLR